MSDQLPLFDDLPKQARTMLALTLHQPHASLIADGHKTYETRSWAAPNTLIGKELAIHASQSKEMLDPNDPDLANLPRGCVVATCLVVGCHQVSWRSPDGDWLWCVNTRGARDDLQLSTPSGLPQESTIGGWIKTPLHGDFSVGRWLWRVGNVTRLPRLDYCKGYQKLWTWTLTE